MKIAGDAGAIISNEASDTQSGFQAYDSYALTGFQSFVAGAGNYTPTAGTRAILVECLGAGGGGGGATQAVNQWGVAAGGGAGGYAIKWITGIAALYAYSIGAAGAAGAAGDNPGGAGGNTTFGGIITCNGGSGGNGGTAFANPGVGLTAEFAPQTSGGTAVGGDFNKDGENARMGINSVATSGGIQSGAGGNTKYGKGGASIQTIPAAGNAGTGYGSGGSGGYADNAGGDRAGGAGTSGLIIVWEFK